MTNNAKKLVVGTSLVAAMAMTSGCSAMGMCGSSKCGNDKKGAKSENTKGASSENTKCGANHDGKCGTK